MRFAALAIVLAMFGCAHDPCKSVEADAIQRALNDASAVLVCAAQTHDLKTCEANQLQQQVQDLAPDALVCGESALTQAAAGQHVATPGQ